MNNNCLKLIFNCTGDVSGRYKSYHGRTVGVRGLQWLTGDVKSGAQGMTGVLGMCTEAHRVCTGDDSENTGGVRGFSYGQGILKSVVLGCFPFII